MSKPTTDAESASGPATDKVRKRAFVVVLSGDRMGETFPLKDDRTTIGRGLQTDVRINDEGISRTHAIVEGKSGVYYLSDAGSTNGTFANGEKVERYALREGDRIQIGASSVLRFTYRDEQDEDVRNAAVSSTMRDRLTGIFARGYFDSRIETDVAFALRHGKPLSLVLFDIDDFSQHNGTLGQRGGDTLLAQVADRIASTTRSEDIFARFGGEEFVLICRDVDAMRAVKAANRICETVNGRPFDVEGQRVSVTLSAGVADLGMLVEPRAEALIEATDGALFVAKRNGKNRIEIYDPAAVDPTRLV